MATEAMALTREANPLQHPPISDFCRQGHATNRPTPLLASVLGNMSSATTTSRKLKAMLALVSEPGPLKGRGLKESHHNACHQLQPAPLLLPKGGEGNRDPAQKEVQGAEHTGRKQHVEHADVHVIVIYSACSGTLLAKHIGCSTLAVLNMPRCRIIIV